MNLNPIKKNNWEYIIYYGRRIDAIGCLWRTRYHPDGQSSDNILRWFIADTPISQMETIQQTLQGASKLSTSEQSGTVTISRNGDLLSDVFVSTDAAMTKGDQLVRR